MVFLKKNVPAFAEQGIDPFFIVETDLTDAGETSGYVQSHAVRALSASGRCPGSVQFVIEPPARPQHAMNFFDSLFGRRKTGLRQRRTVDRDVERTILKRQCREVSDAEIPGQRFLGEPVLPEADSRLACVNAGNVTPFARRKPEIVAGATPDFHNPQRLVFRSQSTPAFEQERDNPINRVKIELLVATVNLIPDPIIGLGGILFVSHEDRYYSVAADSSCNNGRIWMERDDGFYVDRLMDLSTYSLTQAEPDSDWDKFVEASPQGTIFSLTEFVGASRFRPSLWYCQKNKRIVAAVALLETEDGTGCLHAGLLVYNGILFAPHDPNQNQAQRLSEEFRITSAIVRDLSEHYGRLEMSVHYTMSDLRPFVWHNYGTEKHKFDISLRYTSVVEITGAQERDLNNNPVYAACNKSRRQEIRYALKAGVETRESYDASVFEELYRKTFEVQNLTPPPEEMREILSAVDRLKAGGRLRMYQCSEPGQTVGSVAIFGVDSKRAYYLYGANDPTLRSGHTGTAVLWHAFQEMERDGFPEADLEGINSPKRGYFKLSFGGSITPYHILRLRAD